MLKDPTKQPITDAEWEIMRIVWTKKNTTSKEVSKILNEKTEWKNTTVKTLLSRLVQKGMLETKKVGNRFVYTSCTEESKSIELLISKLLAKVCHKKNSDILELMIAKSELSRGDIDNLKELLEQKRINSLDQVVCNCVVGQCNCD